MTRRLFLALAALAFAGNAGAQVLTSSGGPITKPGYTTIVGNRSGEPNSQYTTVTGDAYVTTADLSALTPAIDFQNFYGGTYFWKIYVTSAGTGARFAIANWYLNSSHVETINSNALRFKASIEYPTGSGTMYALACQGSTICFADANAAATWTDPAGVDIPANTSIGLRIAVAVPVVGNKIPQTSTFILLSGSEGYSASRDWTAGGIIGTDITTPTVTSSTVAFAPVAMTMQVAQPTPGVVLVGDSECAGASTNVDTTGDAYGNRGWMSRWLGPSIGTVKFCVGGDTALNLSTQSSISRRMAIAIQASATHVLVQPQINDIAINNASAATVETYLTAIGNNFANAGIIPVLAQISYWSDSSDSWATTTNQTQTGNPDGSSVYTINFAPGGSADTLATWESTTAPPAPFRSVVNWWQWVHAGTTTGTRTLWQVTGSANAYTGDGAHPWCSSGSVGCSTLTTNLPAPSTVFHF
jgi:hypothetical protein